MPARIYFAAQRAKETARAARPILSFVDYRPSIKGIPPEGEGGGVAGIAPHARGGGLVRGISAD